LRSPWDRPIRATLVFGLGALAATAFGCAMTSNGGPGGADMAANCGDGPCAATCATDNDCKNGLHCDPKDSRCVPCVQDSQCPPGQVCAPGSRSCNKGCSMAHPDCGDAGICDPNSNACVQCFKDSDCTDPKNPRCDANQHLCFPCLPTNDNCPHGSYCQQSGNNYVCAAGCKDDTDCGGASPDGGAGDGGAGDGGMAPGPGAHCIQNKCSECKIDTDCPLGKICKAGACVDGCSNVQGCPAQLACCAGKCSDTTLDYQNCGMCGKVCTNGWNCCNSMCSNPQNDVMNCGGCGNTCMVANGIPACTLRQCTIAMCNPGFKDCNGSIKDGCETNTDSNVNNCGACNNPCALPNASPRCVNGMCQVAGCNFGFGDCDMNPLNGCETPTSSDVNNCGGCGMKCALAHATAKCTLGMCQIGACDPGWVDCNKDPSDGCEVDITSDPMNCGGCGKVCSSQNGVASCNASSCQIKCNQNFADCDGNVANGCEVDLLTNQTHCGSCNNSCNNPLPNVQSSMCNGAGACAIAACNNGYFDIDKNPANGCECQKIADGGASCNSPTAIRALAIGDSTTATSNIIHPTDEVWFQANFLGNADPSLNYHPKIALTVNPNNEFVFDVYSNCNNAVPCGGEGGTALSRISWEVQYKGPFAPNPGADPNSKDINGNSKFQPIPAVGNNGAVLVRVRRTSAGDSCDAFTLNVSN
jgi:Cys-rich repeat protein